MKFDVDLRAGRGAFHLGLAFTGETDAQTSNSWMFRGCENSDVIGCQLTSSMQDPRRTSSHSWLGISLVQQFPKRVG